MSSSTTRVGTNGSNVLASDRQSSLTLPGPGKGNKSFANLAKMFGISIAEEKDGHPDSGEPEDGEEDEADPMDEESLLWDAQAALIGHQPAIAMKNYTIAALPPYKSPAACLALGSLLARGSAIMQPETPSKEPNSAVSRNTRSSQSSGSDTAVGTNGKTAAARIREYLFRSPPVSPPVSQQSSIKSPVEKPVAVGWGIPRLGNRAIRNVEGMSIASGWLILGLGWLVDHEATLYVPVSPVDSTHSKQASLTNELDDALSMPSKVKPASANNDSNIDALTSIEPKSSPDLSNGSSSHAESNALKTPHDDPASPQLCRKPGSETDRSESETLKLFYDLLSPLLNLYRHGQIQAQDLVYLPPVTPAQLPACLQPKGDHEKKRNAWHLGVVVMKNLVDLPLLYAANFGKGKGKMDRKLEKRRITVAVMAFYLLGMTAVDMNQSEMYFRKVVNFGMCRQEESDDLVKMAAKRVENILRSPSFTSTPQSPKAEYPFPAMAAPFVNSTDSTGSSDIRTARNHQRLPSTASVQSFMSTASSRIIPSMKSTASLADAAKADDVYAPKVAAAAPTNQSMALDSLRRLRSSSASPLAPPQSTWWPSLSNWTMKPQPLSAKDPNSTGQTLVAESEDALTLQPKDSEPLAKTSKAVIHKASGSLATAAKAPYPSIRTIASSPNVGLPEHPRFATTGTGNSTPRRRLPFEPSDADSINTIDPELAAAELRSALTKHVVCGVCCAKGLNFPECRKCGLTFCSRECRVDEKKAGNGKRHVCGLWESRRFLTVPSPAPRQRRKSVSRSPMATAAA